MPDSYLTLRSPSGWEPEPIKGSRFIARVGPVASEAEAKAFITEVAREFNDARHVCYAWRLGPTGDLTRAVDDGEPGSSAGRPILAQLEGHAVTNTVCAVVRYFGGVKLGVGGLIRAYGGAAGQALDRAEIIETVVREELHCCHTYEASGPVRSVLAAFDLEPEQAEYGAMVTFVVQVPRARREAFESSFRDATAGKGDLTAPLDPAE